MMVLKLKEKFDILGGDILHFMLVVKQRLWYACMCIGSLCKGSLWTSILFVYPMMDNKPSVKIYTVKQLCIPGRYLTERRFLTTDVVTECEFKCVGKKQEEKMV